MFSFKYARVWFVPLVLTVCWHTVLTVSAQGLVGAPVDPRYGQSNEVGQLADYGYDCARDLVRMATGGSAILACLLAWYRSRKVSGKRLAVELSVLILIPVAVYIGGVFSINNLGGLGGCQVAFCNIKNT